MSKSVHNWPFYSRFYSQSQEGEGGVLSLLSLLFSFIYPTVSSGTQSIHSHAAKIEIITQKILEMNNRGGDSRINEGKEEAEENKSWM